MRLVLSLPPDLVADLRRLARYHNVRVSWLVQSLLEANLKRELAAIDAEDEPMMDDG